MPRQPVWSDYDSAVQVDAVVRAYCRGAITLKELHQACRHKGIYQMGDRSERYMVRIKVPAGVLTPAQLYGIGELAGRFTNRGTAHITTRQDFELHGVDVEMLSDLLWYIGTVNLTTLGSGGNGVRNITCCPLAGLVADEPFDVTPYALAVSDCLIKDTEFRFLPRKVKIGFEGHVKDHARVSIHDIGVMALPHNANAEREFLVLVGGGLGGDPMAAQVLEPSTPADLLIPTIVAILRVFDRCGDRINRFRSRMKFLVKIWGIDRFREEVLQLRDTLPRVPITPPGPAADAWPELLLEPAHIDSRDAAYRDWRRSNIEPTREPDWVGVWVHCPLGDLTARQLRSLAELARRFCIEDIRVSNAQDLLLRSVPTRLISNIYLELSKLGLALPRAQMLAHVTRCVGSNNCPSAITRSRDMARAICDALSHDTNGEQISELLDIRVSGCPHGCSHHHIADIGMHGLVKRAYNQNVPCYRIYVGGHAANGHVTFATQVATIPARRITDAVQEIIRHFTIERNNEAFWQYVQRIGTDSIHSWLVPFEYIPSPADDAAFYCDVGQKTAFALPKQMGRT